MIIHGTSDNERPYSGINDFSLSIDEEIQFWTGLNNFEDSHKTQLFKGIQ
ncbi:MAG: hypothetical protein CM15mP4_1140 [Candidatus Neomarinimicrobiota bacterium]|nr:MAG: hypothetical protein CM15mP4_1140 [Candidatus Neomarinimicrobiota bacterium]